MSAIIEQINLTVKENKICPVLFLVVYICDVYSMFCFCVVQDYLGYSLTNVT